MCIISTAQHANPKVMGHIEPCLAQLTILSNVDSTYSARQSVHRGPKLHAQMGTKNREGGCDVPAPFFGVSRESWLDPCCAILVAGMTVEGFVSVVLIVAVGV